MTEKEYLIALCSFIHFGPARTNLLIQYFGSAKSAWETSEKKLLEVGIQEKLVKEFLQYKQRFDPERYFDELNKNFIKVVTKLDEDYPQNLNGIDDAPLVLYLRGELKREDSNAVAIVGSRKMTSYGREVTKKLSCELASLGITIVSGLAFGIDLVAHKSALEVGGRSIAVLASGVDKITPTANEWVGERIINSGGAVVSEFPLGIRPQKHFFPFRNRIISGLSKAVIVVEGMIKSGTIHTANHAARQGRSVFAVPGQITSPTSQAPHYLIKNGAKIITEVKDVLEELDLEFRVDRKKVEKLMPGDEVESKLIGVIANEPLHLDELARITGLRVSEVSGKLTLMELKGLVRHIGGGIYKKV